MAQPEAGRTELVERDAAECARQPDGAPDLVADPGHALLVGAHVGAEDVVLAIAQCARHRANELLADRPPIRLDGS